MKNLTSRERIIILILPTVVIAALYYLFIASPVNKEMAELRRQESALKKGGDRSAKLGAALANLKKIRAEVGQVRKEVNKEVSSDAMRWEDVVAQHSSDQTIDSLLHKNRVILLEEAIASDGDRDKFSAIMEPIPSAELWHLRLAGSYIAVQQTIAEIGNLNLPVIPAAIEMEPMVEGNKTIHLWNLWICR